ncbi:MAG: PqqD family protein [Nitrospirota bacterium]|nr:MAG: PqqD family protein [Nitrospirota bacterium]
MDLTDNFSEKKFRRRDNIVSRKIAGEMFLVPVHGNLADMQKIFSLSSVSELIWDSLDGSSSMSSVLDAVLKEFDVGLDVAQRDLKELIDDLLGEGLIEETT